MKKTILFIAAILAFATSFGQGQTYVNGYTRSNGTYVQGHYRTTPNYTKNDNWSTVGNVNPYTGVEGTKPGGYNSSYNSYSNSTYSNNQNYSTYTPSTYSTYTPSTYSTYTPSTYSTYTSPTSPTYSTVYYSSSCNCYVTQ